MSLIAAAPASSAAPGDVGANVSAITGTPATRPRAARSPGRGVTLRPPAATGGPLRAATAPTSSRSNPASTSAQPVGDRAVGRVAASAGEERVVGDVDDPGGQRRREVERAVGEPPGDSSPTKLDAAMTLRCVYTDLDGTLLGPRGSLFRDPDGDFSLVQARALEACHRAGDRGRDHVRPSRVHGRAPTPV